MRSSRLGVLALVAVAGFSASLLAAVLPEDRFDALYHSYDGGGISVTGPSYLIRKHIGRSLSLWGNYYVDSVSSATIDVVTAATPYHEQRIEKSAGIDYLRDIPKVVNRQKRHGHSEAMEKAAQDKKLPR